MIPVIKKWGNSFTSLMKKARTKKKIQDAVQMPTPEKMLRFDESKISRDANDLLRSMAKYSEAKKLGKNKYCLQREYCLTYACTNNFQRYAEVYTGSCLNVCHARGSMSNKLLLNGHPIAYKNDTS